MTRLGAFIVGLALAACTGGPSPTLSTPATPEPATVGPSGTPVAETAADLLECDGPVSATGGRADEYGPSGGGATADAAFESFLSQPLFPIPLDGYEHLGLVGDRSVYVFDRDGEVKIVIVVSRRFGDQVGEAFTVEEVRMCEVGELGPADFGPGRRVWVHETTGDILTDFAGPEHCEWQSARMLHVEEDGALTRQYLRDPEGVFAFAQLRDSYAEDVDLPADASDSGYRSPEGYELWFTASDRALYVITPEGVERWPRAVEPVGCM